MMRRWTLRSYSKEFLFYLNDCKRSRWHTDRQFTDLWSCNLLCKVTDIEREKYIEIKRCIWKLRKFHIKICACYFFDFLSLNNWGYVIFPLCCVMKSVKNYGQTLFFTFSVVVISTVGSINLNLTINSICFTDINICYTLLK